MDQETITRIVLQIDDMRINQTRLEGDMKAMADRMYLVDRNIEKILTTQSDMIAYLNKGRGIMWGLGLAWSVLLLFVGAAAKNIVGKMF